jgi:hypothetical protein
VGVCFVMFDDILNGKIYIVVCVGYIADIARKFSRPSGGILWAKDIKGASPFMCIVAKLTI